MKIPAWAGVGFLGFNHALVDAATGFWLFSQGNLAEIAWLFLLYNLVGFGLQPLLGLWVDRCSRPQVGASLGLALLAYELWLLPGLSTLPNLAVWGCVLYVGTASALFHVSAGSLSLNSPQPLTSTACFAAPGVLGLSLGTWAAWQNWPLAFPLGLALCLGSLALLWGGQTQTLHRPVVVMTEKQEFLLLALVMAIALRSFFWNQTQLHSPGAWLLWLGLAACVGKLAGGILAQKWGIRKVAWPGIGLALVCLLLPSPPLWLCCLGVAALQSSSPLTLTALGQLLPGRSALAAGLALGFALALGGLPVLLGWPEFRLP
ncbi:MAG: hypothetical protein IV090_17855 [Candidatus Sericytochromatia bacterium]|nr:hypothetical protein [Candidatus Sericytochromatia bacterium]